MTLLANNFFLVSVLLLILVIVIGVGFVLYFATLPVSDRQDGQALPVGSTLSSDLLRATFRQAVETIEANIASRTERYGLPWIVVLGEGEQGRLPLSSTGMPGVPVSKATLTRKMLWGFYDQGVVIDMDVQSTDSGRYGSERHWEEFLDLCRAYRPQRPFDGVVVTIPASLLLDDEASQETIRQAGLMHRRLWLAQNRFAMRLTLYVIVTGCDVIEGFNVLADSVPDRMRMSMLGWSSPFDPAMHYQSTWADLAMNEIVTTVDDTVAEVLASRDTDAVDLLLMTARVRDMRAQLQVYLDELMRPNVYHEPFLLRGVYLTGDTDAVTVVESPSGEEELQAGLRRPAFLRDIFERKVFLEHGLTRPASGRTMSRPMLHRSLRVLLVGAAVVWVGGMVVSAVQMNRDSSDLKATLSQLQLMEEEYAREVRRSSAPTMEWYRRNAISLLAAERLARGERDSWSWFFPGSWPVVDDLYGRVRDIYDRQFELVFKPAVDDYLAGRVAALTSVNFNESTGRLVNPQICRAPVGAADAAGGLTLSRRADLRAMSAFTIQAQNLVQVADVWLQYRDEGRFRAREMQSVMQYVFGQDAPKGALNVLARLNQPEQAVGRREAFSMALRCAFDMGMQSVVQAFYTDSPLLLSERKVEQALERFGNSARSDGAVGLRELADAISAQQELLVTGDSAWLHESLFVPDSALEKVLTTAAAVPMIGGSASKRAQDLFQEGFRTLRQQLLPLVSGSNAGIQWNEQQSRYAVSPARLALLEVLRAALMQPFMQAPADVEPPAFNGLDNVRWDLAQLDQVLASVEARAVFMTQEMAGVPATYRALFRRRIDDQSALSLYRRTVQALQVDPGVAAAPDARQFGVAAERVRKIAAVLGQLGATLEQRDVLDLLSRSAMTALTQLDKQLLHADFFAIRSEVGDSGGALLSLIGVDEAAGLDDYFMQQAAGVQALALQASAFLAALSPADMRSAVAQRWRAIQQESERYAIRNPNSSLLRLEQWLRRAAQTADCATLPDVPAGSDYFGQRLSRMAYALRGRCQGRDSSQLAADWTRFAQAYEQGMAGRAPVADPTGPSRGIAPRPAADVSTVAAVLEQFQRVQQRQAERHISSPGDFMTRLAAWTDLLGPALHDGGYSLDPVFRVNRSAEVAANQLIEWSLSTGLDSIGSATAGGATAKRLPWLAGQPVSLVVRFASNSPLIPREDPKQPRMSVEGSQVRWVFNDAWALFSMLGWQRATQGGTRTQLQFEVPVMVGSVDDLASLPPGQKVRFFMDLGIFAQDKGAVLSWPGPMKQPVPAWEH